MARVFGFLVLLATCGCASQPRDSSDIIFIVPGVGGTVGGMKAALSENRRATEVITWGAPAPLFFLNFSNKSIHDSAESKLAKLIGEWRQKNANGEIDLVGHSAGCGVILGALARLGHMQVDQVVLLAPSVSPTYDLHAAIAHVAGTIHVFYSDRDRTFLNWRTSQFGTYDRVKTRAAGNMGFKGEYPAEKVLQHAYEPQWYQLDNDGGHFGTLSEKFLRKIVAPLVF